MRRHILFFVLFYTGFCTLYSQNNDSNSIILKESSYGFGGHLSSYSGMGASFRYFSSNGIGFKVAILPYHDEVTYKTTDYYNFGSELMLTFLKTQTTKLYWFLGAGFSYDDTKYSDSYNERRIERLASIGSGIGFEFQIIKHIDMSLGVGLNYIYQSTNDYDYKYIGVSYVKVPVLKEGKYLGIGGSVSIYYSF